VSQHTSYTVRSPGDAGLWRSGRPAMGRFEVELTERCNNACIHCYINQPADDRSSRRRELSAEAIIEILREATDLGALSVRFTGGEPLLRDDFSKIYLAARRLGLTVALSTNCCLVTEPIAEMLEKVPPLEPVSVTVYGMSEDSYEEVTRVRGSFSQMRLGVQRLVDHGVHVLLAGTLLSRAAGDVESLKRWATALHALPPTFVVYLHGRGRRDSADRSAAIAALRGVPRDVRDFFRGQAAGSAASAEVPADLLGPRGDRLFVCSAGKTICMDAHGHLLPCLLVRHPEVVYDLSRGSLKEAVTEFYPAMRRKKAGCGDYLERCARCFLGVLCEQCPAWSWTEKGTLDTPVDYVCECAHLRAQDVGLLQPGERAWNVENWKARLTKR
jgi:radical SAM protein with 4Fe4S-binding SPASM domain